MASILRRYMILLVAVAVSASVLVREGVPPLWVFTLHSAVSEQMTKQKIPGMSVAVVTNGRLRWSTAYGLADIENEVAAQPDTVYRLASVSKPITAVAVLRLVERGKLDLDAPIQTYVPSFPSKPWPISSRQLLGHLGGIRHYLRDEQHSVRSYASVTDALAIFRDDPLAAEPGTRHIYTTYGYNLLGAVAEGASGRTYLDLVSAEVFQPSDMTHTRDAHHDELILHRAHGYVRRGDGQLRNSRPADLSNRTPGGGLCGTAEDLARFAIALENGKLLGPDLMRVMFTRQKTRDGRPVDYGLGWSLSRHNGKEEVWHAGHQQQVSTLLYLLPDRKFAVAIMANLEHAELLELARTVADAAAP
ncbi:MAG: serine hydrolase domain-containing protein [Isosphaeraceae bacterium]